MEISPAELLNDYGLSAVHRVSGIPIATLARWRDNDAVPGKKTFKAMREAQLLAAKAKLVADGTPKKRRAA